MAPDREHISVCICTYKRPHLLADLLNALSDQVTEGLFTYSAVVVDNDINKTAQKAVEDYLKTGSCVVNYQNEPEQNIALARNKAVENAIGEYIAFIDDDEIPEATWLFHLYQALHSYNCDAALGPVKPYYPSGTPEWLVKSKLCERPSYRTGTILHWGNTRTGNVLMKKELFDDPTNHFGREFGRTGGEDIEFFRRMAGLGKVFVWCNEAPTYEMVPQDRWTEEFYVQRYLRIGGLVGEKARRRESAGYGIYLLTKSIAWVALMGTVLPVSLVLGRHLYMRANAKIMYNLGLISAFFGRTILRYRDE